MTEIVAWIGAAFFIGTALTAWQGRRGAFRGFVLTFALPFLYAVLVIVRGWLDVRHDLIAAAPYFPIWALGWAVSGVSAASVGMLVGFLGRAVTKH